MSAVAVPATSRTRLQGAAFGVAGQIARIEGVRLVRHPLVLVAVVFGAALMVIGTWTVAPVLNRHDGMTVDALVPLAAAMLILAHLAVTRPLRHRTTDLYHSTPARIGVVTAGHLLSLVWAFGFSLIVALAELIYLKAVGGVGTPRPVVVLTGPALVVLGGALGVALGRFFPRSFAPPLALVGLAAVVAGMLNSGSLEPRHVAESLSPYLPGDHWGQGIGELSLRPLGSHLAYVLSLAATASNVALLRAYRRPAMVFALCVTLAASAVFARQRADTPTPAEELAVAAPFLRPEKYRSCEPRSGIRYCAYPAYLPWIDRWAASAGPVMGATPAKARPKGLAITQLPTDNEIMGSNAYEAHGKFQRLLRRGRLGGPQEVHPGMQWGRNSAAGEFELALALKVAERVTAIDAKFKVTKKDLQKMSAAHGRNMVGKGTYTNCVAFGQARAVVAMWLAARATPGTRATFVQTLAPVGYRSVGQVQLSDFQYRVFGYDSPGIVTWGTREAEYAQQLLQRDDGEIRALVRGNWARLTDPMTTSDQAAAVLGLTPLDPAGSAERQAANYGSPLCR